MGFCDLKLLSTASSVGFSLWLWGFAVPLLLGCEICCFLILGWFLFSVWLWCERLFLHKYVGFAGCGCGVCRRELVVQNYKSQNS